MLYKCPHCGNAITEGSSYCEVCGYRLRKSNSGFLFRFLLWLLGIAAFLLCVTLVCQKAEMSSLDMKIASLNKTIYSKTEAISLNSEKVASENRKLDSLKTIIESRAYLTGNYTNEYVDLGLPSGTKWKYRNEAGLYHIDVAMKKYADCLPTKEQFEEINSYCKVEWQGTGVIVTGPNGNRIFFPVNKIERENSCYGETELKLLNVGDYFYYKPSGMSYHPWVRINSYGIGVWESSSWDRASVRLVKK